MLLCLGLSILSIFYIPRMGRGVSVFSYKGGRYETYFHTKTRTNSNQVQYSSIVNDIF